jgi:hypothetical protein
VYKAASTPPNIAVNIIASVSKVVFIGAEHIVDLWCFWFA